MSGNSAGIFLLMVRWLHLGDVKERAWKMESPQVFCQQKSLPAVSALGSGAPELPFKVLIYVRDFSRQRKLVNVSSLKVSVGLKYFCISFMFLLFLLVNFLG